MADDLWPENIQETSMVTPVSILKEQGALLGEKTNQLLKGEVISAPLGNVFVHRFCIVAPTMSYKYELFQLSHGVTFYPCSLKQTGENNAQPIPSEESFKEALKQVFASEHTLNVVRSILAQARS